MTTGDDGGGPRADAGATAEPLLAVEPSPHFAAWLAEQRVSLAFTTYQAGKLFFIGLAPNRAVSVFERTFPRCMGLCAHGGTLWMSALHQLWRFENWLEPGQIHDGFDRLYVPQLAYTTGGLDIHDLAVGGDGRPVFVNTRFSCLAAPSARYSFAPLWVPPFVSRLAAEDRCHLNGLAMADGRPAFVTAFGQSDTAEGWRERLTDGGCVIDVRRNAVVLDGLSMPHSPRLYRGRLWLLESGTGQFGYADLERGRFEPVAFCPGYARGLDFHGDFAILDVSRPREGRGAGLPIFERVSRLGDEARCAILVVDLRSGAIVHELRIEGVVQELYDVIALPGVRRPMALGFKTDEIVRFVSVAPAAAGSRGEA